MGFLFDLESSGSRRVGCQSEFEHLVRYFIAECIIGSAVYRPETTAPKFFMEEIFANRGCFFFLLFLSLTFRFYNKPGPDVIAGLRLLF
jgi:hypothetical protein